jgi:hypothetical protein
LKCVEIITLTKERTPLELPKILEFLRELESFLLELTIEEAIDRGMY